MATSDTREILARMIANGCDVNSAREALSAHEETMFARFLAAARDLAHPADIGTRPTEPPRETRVAVGDLYSRTYEVTAITPDDGDGPGVQFNGGARYASQRRLLDPDGPWRRVHTEAERDACPVCRGGIAGLGAAREAWNRESADELATLRGKLARAEAENANLRVQLADARWSSPHP